MRNIPVCCTVVQYKELLRKEKKELLRKTRVPSTSSGCTVQEITGTVPGLVSVRAAVVQLPLPAAVQPIFSIFSIFFDLFFTYRHAGSTVTDTLIVSGVNVSTFH